MFRTVKDGIDLVLHTSLSLRQKSSGQNHIHKVVSGPIDIDKNDFCTFSSFSVVAM